MFPTDELVATLNADSYMGAPIFNADGMVTGMIILMDDNPMEEIPNSRYVLSLLASRAGTELDRLRSVDRMQHKIDELTEIVQQKDRFLQLVTHDLKNPFSTVMGFSDILREKIQSLDKGKLYSWSMLLTPLSEIPMGFLKISPIGQGYSVKPLNR